MSITTHHHTETGITIELDSLGAWGELAGYRWARVSRGSEPGAAETVWVRSFTDLGSGRLVELRAPGTMPEQLELAYEWALAERYGMNPGGAHTSEPATPGEQVAALLFQLAAGDGTTMLVARYTRDEALTAAQTLADRHGCMVRVSMAAPDGQLYLGTCSPSPATARASRREVVG